MSGNAIEVRGLAKAYRDGERTVEVLDQIDLQVADGELLAIVGPSGSGKSTLLHVLGALDRPDSGSVAIHGTDLSTLDTTQLADFRNRHLGFVFQFHQLMPDFTALENVAMPGRIAGISSGRLDEMAKRLLSEVDLDHRRDHFPNQLSGGERQRVAICRALLLEPTILLADEPTGNLDPESGLRVLDRLLAMRERRGTTTVLVTHNPEIAESCQRILVLDGGVLRPA